MFNNQLPVEIETLICSIFQFPECKYSQAANMMLLNVEVGRNVL